MVVVTSERDAALRYFRRWQNPDSQAFAEELAAVPVGGEVPEELRVRIAGAKGQMPFSPVLAENRAVMDLLFGGASDLITRTCLVGRQGRKAALFFLESMVKKEEVIEAVESLVDRLRWETLPEDEDGVVEFMERRGIVNHALARHRTFGQSVAQILDGDTVLLLDGVSTAISMGTRGRQRRSPDEPLSEPAVRGPKEGFTENLPTNLSLVRARLKDERLRVEMLTLGSRTGTDVVIVHLAGLALPALVSEVRSRLNRIQLDGVLESGYIQEIIEDHPFSLFPLVKVTERPDVVAAELLEGRVAILTDGTPHALVAPTTFSALMQAAEDYYLRWPMANLLRLLRYGFLAIVLLGPAAYVAMTTFHHEMIPTHLMVTLIGSREGIPFPAVIEALMMEIAFEGLREAGLRLPRPIGQTVSIVGALVIGDAAVRAGLVSPVMIIVVSITAIASFIIPNFSLGLAIRMLRFVLLILAGTLGAYGIILGVLVLLVHMVSMRSFGVPYLSPVMPPTAGDMKDVAVRAPWWSMRHRPRFMPVRDPVRQEKRKPQGPPGEGEG